MTLTNTESSASVAPTATPINSSFNIAVVKISEETGRPLDEARACLIFITEMAEKARSGARLSTPGTHHLTDDEMDTVAYETMDQVMEHGSVALPDSAHAAIETAVLGPNEFALIHDNPTGMPSDCVVTVSLRSAS